MPPVHEYKMISSLKEHNGKNQTTSDTGLTTFKTMHKLPPLNITSGPHTNN